MKLELIQKWEVSNFDITFMYGSIIIPNKTLIILSKTKSTNTYCLLLINSNFTKTIQLDYIPKTLSRNYPTIINIQNGFGIIWNVNEINYYRNIDITPEIINIKNKKIFNKVIPKNVELKNYNAITDSNIYPISMEHNFFTGQARNYGLLKLKTNDSKWQTFSEINKTTFEFHLIPIQLLNAVLKAFRK